MRNDAKEALLPRVGDSAVSLYPIVFMTFIHRVTSLVLKPLLLCQIANCSKNFNSMGLSHFLSHYNENLLCLKYGLSTPKLLLTRC